MENKRWTDHTLALAAQVYGMERGTIDQAARACRVIYDKIWHGRNQAKTYKQKEH